MAWMPGAKPEPLIVKDTGDSAVIAAGKELITGIAFWSVIVAEADLVGSAKLVAVTVTLPGTTAGAV
jgi:hypothetical protein